MKYFDTIRATNIGCVSVALLWSSELLAQSIPVEPAPVVKGETSRSASSAQASPDAPVQAPPNNQAPASDPPTGSSEQKPGGVKEPAEGQSGGVPLAETEDSGKSETASSRLEGDANDTQEPNGVSSRSQASPSKQAPESEKSEPEGKNTAAPKKPSIPEADKPPLLQLFSFQVLGDIMWNTDPGYDAFAEDDTSTATGVALGYDVAQLASDFTLFAQVDFSFRDESRSGFAAGFFGTASYEATDLSAGAGLRYDVLPFLSPHVRVAADWTRAELTLDGADLGPVASEDSSLGATIGAGFSLHTLPSRIDDYRSAFNSVSVGVAIEGGYRVAPAVELSVAERGVDPPDQRIRSNRVALGDLERGGQYVRISGLLRF